METETNPTGRAAPPGEAKPPAAPPAAAAQPQTPPRSLPLPTIQLKRILAPIDFSDPCRNAVRYAVSLAGHFKAEIHLLYVLDPALFANEVLGALVEVSKAEVIEKARAQLSEFAAREIGERVPVYYTVGAGQAYHEITTMAQELSIDLIIIATRGRTGLKHALLGSTTERVVRFAPCPVLCVREHQREFIAAPASASA